MFDALDWLVIVGSVALLTGATLGLAYLVYRRSSGPGERLASRGASRIILRTLTRGGDVQRWN